MNGPHNPIGWCDYSWNPVTGCLNNCWYCYVRRLEKRFGYSRMPQFHRARLKAPRGAWEGSRVFVCSTADLFGPWVPQEWIDEVLAIVRSLPNITFQFLTKFPQRYLYFKFPKNCWLGTTIESSGQMERATWITTLHENIRFISFEPLLGDIPEAPECGLPITWFSRIDWMIVGAFTGDNRPRHQPKREWIHNLVQLADKYNVPVFMKNNLKDIWQGPMRQEYPMPLPAPQLAEVVG